MDKTDPQPNRTAMIEAHLIRQANKLLDAIPTTSHNPVTEVYFDYTHKVIEVWYIFDDNAVCVATADFNEY